MTAVFWSLFAVLFALPLAAAQAATSAAEDPPRHSAFPATIVELTIPSHGMRLPGHIYLASGQGPHPTVVFLHGLPGNERNLDLAQALRRAGFNALFFHYRGAWGAEGEYRMTQLPDDALAVLNWLREPGQLSSLRIDGEKLSVLGHSLGGYAALASGARDADLACVVALSPANLLLWQRAAGEKDEGFDALAAYADSLFMLRGFSGQVAFEELTETAPAELDTAAFGAGLRGKSVLMMVGERDETTPPDTMFDPVVAAYEKVEGLDLTVRKLDDDHSFSSSRLTLAAHILAWTDAHCR
jgi:pimeloyl-ACP methyl ester carboxylesterase